MTHAHIRLLSLVVVVGLLTSCGLVHKKYEDKRDGGAGEATADGLPSVSPEQAETAASQQPGAAKPGPDFAATVGGDGAKVVDSLNRSFDSYFFQAYAVLTDLFTTGDASGASMLCFPAALAYQIEYRRFHALAVEEKLPHASEKEVADSGEGAKAVRFYAEYCQADLKKGMTIPQGLGCLEKMYVAANLTGELNVIGQDAQWAEFGMFPKKTKADLHAVSPEDLRDALDRDESVIALVGAYKLVDGRMQRFKGHFISFAGYEKTTNGDKSMKVTIVDPSTDYRTRASGRKFNQAQMDLISTADKAAGLPQFTAYQLDGFDIGADGAKIVIETLLTFK